MAILGLTKLQTVNNMLRAKGELPVTALDTGGASIAARAEEVLDRVNQRLQIRGFAANTIRSKAYTLDGSGKLTMGSDVLRVQAAGPDQDRKFELRGDDLYDVAANKGTDVIGSPSGSVYLDVVVLLAFEDMPPAEKEFIGKEAEMEFQRRYRSSPEQDGYIREEAAKVEIFTRPAPPQGGKDLNSFGPLSIPGAAPTPQGA